MQKIKQPFLELLVRLFVGGLNLIYIPFKLLPAKDKVTFISRLDYDAPIDFRLIIESLERHNEKIEITVLCKKLEFGLMSKLKYAPHIFRQMYHIATSKVVVVDSYCIPLCVLHHKKSLKVIQLWHGLGSFKKFGRSILDRKESISGHVNMDSKRLAEIMHMHANYDVMIASNSKSAAHFAEAFGYDKKFVRVISLPRVDFLTDAKKTGELKSKIIQQYPSLKDKTNILYAPTFRRNQTDSKKLRSLIDSIDYDKYNLIIKPHPLTGDLAVDSRAVTISDFTSMQLLTVSDYVVTDYSAIIYEAFLLGVPVFMYTYDKDRYVNNRGFYTPISEMPVKEYTDAKKLIRGIDDGDYNNEEIRRFIDAQVVHKSGNSNKLADIILKFMGREGAHE